MYVITRSTEATVLVCLYNHLLYKTIVLRSMLFFFLDEVAVQDMLLLCTSNNVTDIC